MGRKRFVLPGGWVSSADLWRWACVQVLALASPGAVLLGGPSLRAGTSPGALCPKGHTSPHMGHITGLVLMETGGLTVTQAKQNQKIVLQSK